jgi:hypothetical protein
MRVTGNLQGRQGTERRTLLGKPPLGGFFPEMVCPAPVAPARADAAAWVRDNLPTCADFAAQCRAAFGEARLLYASENGHTIGKPSDPPGYSVTGGDLPVLQKPTKGKR